MAEHEGPSVSDLGAVMRSEWIKLRTVRMNLVLVIIGVAIPFVICGLTAVLSDDTRTREDILGFTTGASVLTALIVGVVGASSITGEFTHNTIRPTFAATPRRLRVLVAKAIVLVTAAAAVTGVVVIGAYALTLGISEARDLVVGGDFDSMPALLGTIVFAMLVTLFGFGIGMVVRNQPTAISLLLLWPLLVEGLIGAMMAIAGVDNPFRWLPYNAGLQLAAPTTGNGPDSIGRVAGGLIFAVFVTVIATTGSVITARRDA
jgi:ABC-2 type transport system permease protein